MQRSTFSSSAFRKKKSETIHTKAHFQICSSLFPDLKTCDLGNTVQVISFFLSIQKKKQKQKTNKQRIRLVHHSHLLYGSDISVKIIFPISST